MQPAKIGLMPGRLYLRAVTSLTSIHCFHAIRLFPEHDSSGCVTHVAPDMPDVVGTVADMNGKVQICVLSKINFYPFFAMKHLYMCCLTNHIPVIRGRQESSHGGDLSSPRTPSFRSRLTPIRGGVGGYAY